jgi:hypothetical protein
MSWKTEYWETLCHKADKAVGKIFENLVNGKFDVKKAMISLSLIPYEYPSSELAKETVNKFIDHAVETLGIPEEELVMHYQNEDCNVGLAKWTWDVAHAPYRSGEFEVFWNEVKEGYLDTEWDELRKISKSVWDDAMNNDTLWANSFFDYWKHKNSI